MPQRRKEHDPSQQQPRSRWHNIHFSGKLILCSVIFGLMLVLVGGIVMAIGMDNDNDGKKSDDYADLQKKPPLAIVGPVIMGIGGFTVIVGVIMCLVETKVCRRKSTDMSPLIREDHNSQEFGATGRNAEHPETPSHSRRQNHRQTSPSPRKSKHSHSPKNRIKKKSPAPGSPSSAPISVISNSGSNFLSASDKFVTPVSSFVEETNVLQTQQSRDAENQTSASLLNSGMSWSVSAEFQTPGTSFEDSLTLNPQIKEALPTLNAQNLLHNPKHAFLTPKNSDAESWNIKSSSDEHILEVESSTETLEEKDTSHTYSHANTQLETNASELHTLVKEVDDTKRFVNLEPRLQQIAKLPQVENGQITLESSQTNTQESTEEIGVNVTAAGMKSEIKNFSQSNTLETPYNNSQINILEQSKHEFLTPKNSVVENIEPKPLVKEADDTNRLINLEPRLQQIAKLHEIENERINLESSQTNTQKSTEERVNVTAAGMKSDIENISQSNYFETPNNTNSQINIQQSKHEYLTPKNSVVENTEPKLSDENKINEKLEDHVGDEILINNFQTPNNTSSQIDIPEHSKHEFLTPKNSNVENIEPKPSDENKVDEKILEDHVRDEITLEMECHVDSTIQETPKDGNLEIPDIKYGSNQICQDTADKQDNLTLPIASEDHSNKIIHEHIKCEEASNDNSTRNDNSSGTDVIISSDNDLNAETQAGPSEDTNKIPEVVCTQLKDSNVNENSDLENVEETISEKS